ncbi:response regulator [Actinoplanes subtropicus]|uniref:response regulator n=1 Tax=Actinoplanes subtropicus TaxID=543632 RepID=UPI000AE62E05|nr:response regulator [Actinoplanes subtropicus]
MTGQIEPAVGSLLATAIGQAVRTPLHSLLGFLELLGTTDLDDEGRSLVREARAGGEALLLAGDRVTALVQVLTDPRPGPAERIPVKQLLAEVAATADPVAPPRTEVNPYVPATVDGDGDALRHALLGLAECAVRHDGRDIRLSVERTSAFADRTVRIRACVRWDGAGLTAAEITALTTDTPPSGTEDPMLLLTNRMIRRLGAQLTVAETHRVTTLALDVDLRATGVAADEPAGRPATLRVLLIEDNPVNRLLTERQLRRLGHELDVVEEGLAGLKALREGGYDVLLVDRHLPDIDGVEVARRVRAAERDGHLTGRTPIVAVTADASAGHRERCLAAGMDAFLTKPLDLTQLQETLLEVLSRPGPTAAQVDPAAITRLRRRCDGDEEQVRRMIRAYLDDLEARVDTLASAVAEAAPLRVQAAAETLREASELLGGIRLARACAFVGMAAADGDLAGAAAVLPDLRASQDEVRAWLEGMLGEPALAARSA